VIKTIEPGRVVYSVAGHDKDRYYIILGCPNKTHCLVADGRTHTVDKPKRKNIKHLNTCDKVFSEISEKLATKRLNDSRVSCLLSEFRKKAN